MTKFTGFVGTYTKGNSRGIYSLTLDTATAKIEEPQLAAELENPTYLAISRDNQFLYSVVKEGDLGGVAAFALDKEKAKLTPLNHQVTTGAPPCHVSVDSKNRNIVSANYHKGTIDSYLLNMDGTLQPPASVVEHQGTGPDPRQEKPHTHYSGFTPDEKYVIAVDLGCDKVYTYELDNGILTERHQLSVKAGSGPRHIVFHPHLKMAYVMTELSSEVIVLSYNEIDGSFTEVQYISTIPDGFEENSQGSAIHISSDGKFIYAGNRGHNSIAVFNINQDSGELSFVEHASTAGKWPRDFALDPSEKYIVASNQESSSLVLFERNPETGKLTLVQSDIVVPDPVCVKFLHD
ncbi:lactonase family protein [Robertmurraya andreesenii]|uniref:6-phosphogluconolactonase n=1 Tax=Anoxybacillus andreesenii TaxID=1325932 RepID=A0ABT9UYI5_9BACL|nr:lactonase family protein [Robertmurraya andreesenii]MDQ0153760.1 6-phosphogluconolactonase [Robertmurraya andreesenii]